MCYQKMGIVLQHKHDLTLTRKIHTDRFVFSHGTVEEEFAIKYPPRKLNYFLPILYIINKFQK